MAQIFGMELNWLVLALIGMLFASATNLTLKVILKNYDVTNYDFKALLPIVAIVFVATAAVYLLFLRKLAIPSGLVQLVLVFIVFAVIGFAAVVYAMQTGKVALVTAVLSLSTVVVAIASFFIFGDRFSYREMISITLAFFAILMLII
ncbi:MAG: EamA family transporter [Candidatus Micrarchaeota archaeon]